MMDRYLQEDAEYKVSIDDENALEEVDLEILSMTREESWAEIAQKAVKLCLCTLFLPAAKSLIQKPLTTNDTQGQEAAQVTGADALHTTLPIRNA
jgi:hypothetical protein